MKTPEQFWLTLRASLWFVPGLLATAGIGLAAALIQVDVSLGDRLLRRWPMLFGAGAEGSRSMLAAIATSTITIAGVTFSITIVALSLASTQYSPRTLRNFMRDRRNQFVLGTFVGIFTYSLIVLRTIRNVEEGGFVPSLAVAVGVALGLVGMGMFIFFIHHIATSIQPWSILAAVARETFAVIDRRYPQGPLRQGGCAGDVDRPRRVEASTFADGEMKLVERAPALGAGEGWRTLPAPRTGYLRSVDTQALVRFARDHRAFVRMHTSIGEFVVEGLPLAHFSPACAPVADLGACFDCGSYRTIEQDPGFGVQQIVDMALKGLSPGINDTTTALDCIDYLTAILVRLATRRITPLGPLAMNEPRIVGRGPTFEEFVALSFGPISEHARGNVAVLLRLLSALETTLRATDHPARRAALVAQARMVAARARRTVLLPEDLARIESRARAVAEVPADSPA